MKHLFISFLLLPIQTNPFHLPVTIPIESHSKLVHNNIANNENGNVEDITIEQYSRCLSPKEEKQSIKREASLYSIVDARPRWQRVLIYLNYTLISPQSSPCKGKPFTLLSRTSSSLLRKAVGSSPSSSTKKPGSLILLRCGESEWTKSGRFTGWLITMLLSTKADPDLVREGVLEIEHAGRLLLSEGYEPDILYTSRLKRAVKSTWSILNTLNAPYLPVYKSWRLNERNYGALTGLKKMDAAKELGVEVVQAWRNSLKARPPPMKKNDEEYPGKDRRYDDLTEDQIPLTESLMDCMERARPLWEYAIKNEIQKGNTVLVVAHTNTLRGLMKHIDNIEENAITEVSMPGGIPFVYKFDNNMKPLPPEEGKISQAHTYGVFLEKPGLLKEALKRNKQYNEVVPGSYGQVVSSESLTRSTTLEKALLKLKEDKDSTKGGFSMEVNPNDDGTLIVTNSGSPSSDIEDDMGDAEFEEFFNQVEEADSSINVNIQKASEVSPGIAKMGESKDPVVQFRTPHNNLGLFTGWEDPPLAPDGVEDAKNAGRLLKIHGFEFDVGEFSFVVTLEAERTNVWRSDGENGEAQLKKWRRVSTYDAKSTRLSVLGFKIRPPAVSSYSFNYPGNDYKRTKYVKDLPISLSETINRSIEARSFQIHRKFPNATRANVFMTALHMPRAESLWDCMQRSIPFYTQRIVPEAVNTGKRVLVTSHENAIRGILMYLCDIPEDAMNQLHLPNGVPLVYNVKRKCITLLDDGSGVDPMEKYDFGPAAQYLFRPCELGDDFFDQMEQQAIANQAGKTQLMVKLPATEQVAA
eukprot:scaffold4177_cov86-Cyclotella_meneghiniana.AAC.7